MPPRKKSRKASAPRSTRRHSANRRRSQRKARLPPQSYRGNLKIHQIEPDNQFQTGVYVYSIDPSGHPHFAFGRKVPPGRRVSFGWKKANPHVPIPPSTALTGAAGTKAEYHGKWTSFGGGADSKATTPLQAAIIELNDEADLAFDHKTHVYVQWSKHPYNSQPLILERAFQPMHRLYIFVFSMKWPDFISCFPNIDDKINARGGQAIVDKSHGEIDFVASFSIDQIVNYQTKAYNTVPQNNFFAGYAINTLKNVIQGSALSAPLLHLPPPALQSIAGIPLTKDVNPRNPQGWRDGVTYQGIRNAR